MHRAWAALSQAAGSYRASRHAHFPQGALHRAAGADVHTGAACRTGILSPGRQRAGARPSAGRRCAAPSRTAASPAGAQRPIQPEPCPCGHRFVGQGGVVFHLAAHGGGGLGLGLVAPFFQIRCPPPIRFRSAWRSGFGRLRSRPGWGRFVCRPPRPAAGAPPRSRRAAGRPLARPACRQSPQRCAPGPAKIPAASPYPSLLRFFAALYTPQGKKKN